MLLKKIFKFDAAHNLTNYNGKCENLHGHTYKLVVTVEGKPDDQDMVIDFVLLKKIVHDEVINILDHAYINDIIENPTAENIAKWIWGKLSKKIEEQGCRLYEIEVWETEDSSVIYRGENE